MLHIHTVVFNYILKGAHMNKVEKLVEKIRHASRDLIREFGILSKDSPYGIPVAYRHVLLELETHGALTHMELAPLLNLEKSTISRIIKSMTQKKIVAASSHNSDQRFRYITLTEAGKELLNKVNEIANAQTYSALEQLNDKEQNDVLLGLELYVKALKRSRLQSEYCIRKISKKDNLSMTIIIRNALKEYGGDRPGTAYYDDEIIDLHKAYLNNQSSYFVIERIADKKIVGGAGIAPLENKSKTICELRKMYFAPEARGLGLGKTLLQMTLNAAAKHGYKQCYIETLSNMHKAKQLYKQSGFTNLNKPLGNTGHYNCDEWLIKELT